MRYKYRYKLYYWESEENNDSWEHFYIIFKWGELTFTCELCGSENIIYIKQNSVLTMYKWDVVSCQMLDN